MLYNPPSGATDPNAPYVGKNTAGGIQGSRVPKNAIEHPQREIVNAIVKAGLVPSATDLFQLSKAIQRGKGNFAQATGSGNAWTAALDPTPPGLGDGLVVNLICPAENTGPVTLTLNGFAAAPILRRDGQPLLEKDTRPGMLLPVMRLGSAFLCIGAVLSDFVRPNALFYVRNDGSDSNNGLAPTAAGAFATIAGAITAISKLFMAGTTPIIQLVLSAPNTQTTFALPETLPPFGGSIAIQGDPTSLTTASNYVLSSSGPSGSTGSGVIMSGANGLAFLGLTIANTGTSHHTLIASEGGTISLNTVRITGGGASWAKLYAARNGSIVSPSDLYLAGPASSLFFARGYIRLGGTNPIIVAGSPNFSDGAAYAADLGLITLSGPAISGTASGRRYNIAGNSVVKAFGAGPNAFPGNASGTTDGTGSVYIP